MRRYHAIDSLRAAMICVVMFGHALLPYVTVPRRFKDPATHPAFDVVALFLYGLAMPLFFLTAGFAAAALLERRGVLGLIVNRLKTIVLPLLIAYALLSPLTRGAYLFASTVSTSGSIASGVDILLAGEWIRWSKAYHLWFLVALLLYTGMALALRWVVGQGPSRVTLFIRERSRHLFDGVRGVFLLSLLSAVFLIPAYSAQDGDVSNVPMQLHLLSFFIVGWLLYLHRSQLPAMGNAVYRWFVVALAVLPVAAWSTRLRWLDPGREDVVIGSIAGVSSGIMVACMCFAFLGLFQKKFGERPSAVGQYLSDASYWIFLIHFPLLIAVAGMLSAADLPAIAKYLLTIVVVLPVVMLTYHFMVRRSVLGRLLKGRKKAEL